MKHTLNHLFVLLFVLGITFLLIVQPGIPSRPVPNKRQATEPIKLQLPNLSLLLTRQPGSDLFQLFVQNLDPHTAVLISQEVFTLQRLDNTASIAHYTSSSPNHVSPSAISQPRSHGTVLSKPQQTEFQVWLRTELEARLKRLDQALQRRTSEGIFAALKLVHDQSIKNPNKHQDLLPWIFLPAQHAPKSGTYDMQAQLYLEPKAFENLESFAQRVNNDFQQRSSSPKSRP